MQFSLNETNWKYQTSPGFILFWLKETMWWHKGRLQVRHNWGFKLVFSIRLKFRLVLCDHHWKVYETFHPALLLRPSSFHILDLPSNISFSPCLGSWSHSCQPREAECVVFHTSTLTWECTVLYVKGSSSKSSSRGQRKSQHISFVSFQILNRICRSIAKNIWQSSGFFVGNYDASSLAGKQF